LDLKEFYKEAGIEFETVVGRFGGAEALVRRFLGKFKNDGSFAVLEEGIEKMDLEMIERGSHSLKGVASNLGLANLQKYAEAVLAHVRTGGDVQKAKELFQPVKEEYDKVISRLENL